MVLHNISNTTIAIIVMIAIVVLVTCNLFAIIFVFLINNKITILRDMCITDGALMHNLLPSTTEVESKDMSSDIADKDKREHNYLSITIDMPKIQDAGEDASPLFVRRKNISIIGVFDGMGGAGAEVYYEGEIKHTGAYIASRAVKDIVEQFVAEKDIFEQDNIPIILKEDIKDKLLKKKEGLTGTQSGLKSRMIKTLPTTMAISGILLNNNRWKIKVLWAGDSRVYLLSPQDGLIQLTKDDLSIAQDPFLNLYNDSSLSNMVNLSQDFIINEKNYESNLPCVVLAASDGCFGYLPSPMHFEHMLLDTMQDSSSIDEWERKLIERLKDVTSDDCSMALMCSDVEYEQLKNNFNDRWLSLYEEIKTINKEINIINRNAIKDVCEKHWSLYKQTNYPFND